MQRGTWKLRIRASVHGVADDRVTDRREVHPNLVSAPGAQRQFEDSRAGKALEHAKVGHRLAATLDDRHAPPVARVPGDRRVDRPRVLTETAVDERPIRASERAVAELASQVAMCCLSFRHHKEAARVAVEAMDDACPLGAAEQRPGRPAFLERVGERPGGMPRSGMDDHPRRLVDNGEPIVLIDDAQLGPGMRRVPARRGCGERVSRPVA